LVGGGGARDALLEFACPYLLCEPVNCSDLALVNRRVCTDGQPTAHSKYLRGQIRRQMRAE
jgi:hypothetical protein